MKKENNLYNYSTPKSGNEESSFFLINGRITTASLYLRITLSIGIYGLSYLIYDQFGYYFKDIVYGFVATLHMYLIPFFLVVFVLIQGAKRMHDIDKSGWYFLIPLYNIYLSFEKGTLGSNNYGMDPKIISNVTYFDELDDNLTNLKNKQGTENKNNIDYTFILICVLLFFVLIAIIFQPKKQEYDNSIGETTAIDTTGIDTTGIDAAGIDTTSVVVDTVASTNTFNESDVLDIKTVTFTNNSSETAWLVYAFLNNNNWETIGWYEIKPKNSESFTLPDSFSGDSIYWYAEDSNDNRWEGNDGLFCVTHDDAFHFYTSQSNENCKEERSFYKLNLTGSSTYQGFK